MYLCRAFHSYCIADIDLIETQGTADSTDFITISQSVANTQRTEIPSGNDSKNCSVCCLLTSSRIALYSLSDIFPTSLSVALFDAL